MNIASNIYNFADYRDFLKDRYRQLKDVDPAFSFRNFSKEAGFGSPNYLKLVMDGKRNLSDEAIAKFAKGLRLDTHESEFFRYMVLANQCSNTQQAQVYEAKLCYLKELFKVKEVIPELYEYYHDWYHSAIREMIKKGSVQNDAQQIAMSMVPNITVEEATKSINLLKQLGFIAQNLDGSLEAIETTQKLDTTGTEMGQKIHHEQMAALAAQSLYTQSADNIEFESLTVSLPAHKVEELKTKIQDLIQSIAGGSNASNANVYQLNIQLFALTKATEAATSQTDSPEKRA